MIERPKIPTRMTLLLAVLLMVSVSTIMSADTAQSYAIDTKLKSSGFCKATFVRHLAHPPGASKSSPIADSGKLPFGPRSLRVLRDGPRSGVLIEGGRFGYDFASRAPVQLDWLITAKGFAVNRSGAAQRRFGEVTRTISSVGGPGVPSIDLSIPNKRGFYLIRLSIQAKDGKLLGTFTEYITVAKPTVAVRIGLDGSPGLAGSQILGRIENFGTTSMQFGPSYAVEHFDGTTWQRVGPSRSVWPRQAIVLEAGAAGGCMGYKIPEQAPTGRYRFVKSVEVRTDKSGLTVKPVHKEFEVALSD